MGESVWDILFPQRCVGCGAFGKLVCEKCEIGMGEADQICPGCGRNSRGGMVHPYCCRRTALEGLVCMWEYEGVVKKLIGEGKYRYYYDNLRQLLLMRKPEEENLQNFFEFVKTAPVVVPVPLYRERERNRGFNQAKIIGQSLAERYKLPLMDNWLLRTRDTGQQVGRTRQERLKAMEGAFSITPRPPLNSSLQLASSAVRGGANCILLVDDVWTTGTTMGECAKTLKRVGVKRVWGLVLAR